MNISPSEPVWLDLNDILEAHEEQIDLFGGAHGIRDIGLIESALVRAQQLYHYEGEEDVLTLAVRLGIGLARNHGFLDGNKRAGAIAILEFLALNGFMLALPDDEQLGLWIEQVVSREMSEDELVSALEPFVRPWAD